MPRIIQVLALICFNLLRMPVAQLKGHSNLWDCASLDACLLILIKVRKYKVPLEIFFNLHSVFLDFHSFTKKPVFECAFAHPMILFLSHLVKTSMNCSNARVHKLGVSL